MQQNPKEPEFVKTIGEIKGAEEEHDRIITEAKEKADRILREAKERVVDENTKNSDNIVQYKNEKLRHGSTDIEGKVAGLIKKAKDDAAKTRKKSIASSDVSKLVKEFLDSL